MAIIVPNQGELELLDKMLKDALDTDENYSFRLFKNDYTPDQYTVEGDFEEADFTNYVAGGETLTRANFGAASLNINNEAETSYSSELSWTCGSTGNTVYGYYVLGATSLKVLWTERFAAPRVMTDTDILKITPTFTFRSQN